MHSESGAIAQNRSTPPGMAVDAGLPAFSRCKDRANGKWKEAVGEAGHKRSHAANGVPHPQGSFAGVYPWMERARLLWPYTLLAIELFTASESAIPFVYFQF